MKPFLRKDGRSFYFLFCVLFLGAIVIYRLISDERPSVLNSILLISVALLNLSSAFYSLYDVRKKERNRD
ncbi:hypothetical protein [Capnocytophaga sp. oral taxon 863]|uniref:hypothetical protein n=1 Tax=Capnocytophaga sp. oral taxon 863 TaxID=1227265 RepID=UPI0004237ACA|nr:hypothetical protein [Capnocytophaga sp. oral taxon 863]